MPSFIVRRIEPRAARGSDSVRDIINLHASGRIDTKEAFERYDRAWELASKRDSPWFELFSRWTGLAS